MAAVGIAQRPALNHIDRTAKQRLEFLFQSYEIKKAPIHAGTEIDQQINITVGSGIFSGPRSEQGQTRDLPPPAQVRHSRVFCQN